jgi:hypothetical protein
MTTLQARQAKMEHLARMREEEEQQRQSLASKIREREQEIEIKAQALQEETVVKFALARRVEGHRMDNPDASRWKFEETRRQKHEALTKRNAAVEQTRREDKEKKQRLKEESVLNTQLAVNRQKFRHEAELARLEFVREHAPMTTPQRKRERSWERDGNRNNVDEQLATAMTDRESLMTLAQQFGIDFDRIEREVSGRH